MGRSIRGDASVRRAFFTLLLGFASAVSGCGSQSQGLESAAGGAAGDCESWRGDRGGAAMVGGAGPAPYVSGPHGGADQPCYPNGTCSAGFLCQERFVCVAVASEGETTGNAGAAGSNATVANRNNLNFDMTRHPVLGPPA